MLRYLEGEGLDENEDRKYPSAAMKIFDCCPNNLSSLESTSTPADPAHSEIPGSLPPEISLKAEAPPVSSSGTGALVKETYIPSVYAMAPYMETLLLIRAFPSTSMPRT